MKDIMPQKTIQVVAQYFFRSVLLILLPCTCFSQRVLEIKDLESKECLPFVIVYNGGQNSNVYETDEKGTVRLPTGNILWVINHVSYRDTSIYLTSNFTTIYLKKGKELSEILIESKRPELIRNSGIKLDLLKTMPALGGEIDIIKSLTMTAGISPTVEGTSSISVRGGSPDQNLILIDGSKVYSAGHLFGFLSTINDKVVKDLNVYKSYIPPSLPTRLSSVIDIKLKDGNKTKIEKELTIGLLNSNFKIDGPINDKTTFLVSGRGAYTGLIFSLAALFNKSDKRYYNVYDFDAKISNQTSKNSRLSVSTHSNFDFFQTQSEFANSEDRFNINWGNHTFATNYTFNLGSKFSNTSQLNFTKYDLFIKASDRSSNDTLIVKGNSGLQELSFRNNSNFMLFENFATSIGFGIERLVINPMNTTITTNEERTILNNNIFRSSLYSVFFETKIPFGSQISLDIGSSLDYFYSGTGQTLFQPRMALKYYQSNSSTFFVELASLRQNLHSLASGSAFNFIDVWIPTTNNIKPQKVNSINLGYLRSLYNGLLGVEAYYKDFFNQIYIREGETFLISMDTDIEGKLLLNGLGRAWGIEFYGEKVFTEDITLNFNYTLSKSSRRFKEINDNEWFDYDYDRRHRLNIAYKQKIGASWSFASNFVFYTGIPVSLPETSHLTLNGFLLPVYTKTNNGRLPIYNRADVAWSNIVTTKKGNERIWSLSFYNVYAYPNIFGFTTRATYIKNSYQLEINKSYFFRWLPSLSYTLKFK